MRFNLVLGLLTVSLLGCGPRKIPGTDIDDTSETRAVLDVLQAYRRAVEKRDARAIVALTDESFRDDGGSATPDDDLDYRTLGAQLGDRFTKVADVRLDVTVRRVEFDDDAGRARVTYSYSMSFKMPDFSARTQSETDIKQMWLKRVGEQQWKITSGI